MARHNNDRDTTSILSAAELWIRQCLIQDGSVFVQGRSLWTAALTEEVFHAFVEHPDYSGDDFLTKLKRQLASVSTSAQQLTSEFLWALLLFPSNVKPRTKRHQIMELWNLSGEEFPPSPSALSDDVLVGIGSGGPGFNNYRPDELEYLISIVRDLKKRDEAERQRIFRDYDTFFVWIDSVPRRGSRQFRHMLRFFTFPDRVERISSNNDRRKILKGFAVAPQREISSWSDRQLDEKLVALRSRLQAAQPDAILDFYETPLKEQWSGDRTIKTIEGEVKVTVPSDDDEIEDNDGVIAEPSQPSSRQSIQIQSKLARIGSIMGFKVWLPRADRSRVCEFLSAGEQAAIIENLPLNYDNATLDTIEQIDVLWLKGRSIARAFEVEHTTAVYSGLLRMADLLALQPNMDIRLHIVAPDERREKVFREMKRPVFSLLDRGRLADICTFISYDNVNEINGLQHLAHTNDGIIAEYEEKAE
jgi:hypothetical protein